MVTLARMTTEELSQIAASDPGSNEAIDLLVRMRRAGCGFSTSDEARIVDAWAQRLHARTSYQGRMSPWLREERVNSIRSWLHEQMSEWKPGTEGREGSPAAFINTRRTRLTKELPIETGTPADHDEKARRVLAALKAEMAEGGDDLSTLKDRTEERLLLQHAERLADTSEDLRYARESMRKRGDLKWLARMDELLATFESYEETAASAPDDTSSSVFADTLDLLVGGHPARQQQNILCAPHLQYLLVNDDTRL